MRRATGTRKNLILTLWLLLPFAVLALIVTVIFATYGNTKMNARPVGPGAGDTGGANAIGELLAGNDPDERARTNRALREGRLIDPLEWPAGIRVKVVLKDTGVPVHHIWLWGGEGTPAPADMITTGYPEPAPDPEQIEGGDVGASSTWPVQSIRRIFEQGHPGAGVYVSRSEDISVRGSTLFDADGSPLRRVEINPVPADQAIEGQPIDILIELRSGEHD